MRTRTDRRDRGVILLFALLLTILVMALSTSVAVVSMSESKVTFESVEDRRAFYLAEAGLEAARWEISESQDGNINGSFSDGTYLASTVALGPNEYEITSTGSADGSTVTLRSVVEQTYTTNFPRGAVSVVGAVDKAKFDLEKDGDLVIDGGNSPALAFSDFDVYKGVGEDIVKAITDNEMPAGNLTGSPMNTFPDSVDPTLEIPVAHVTGYDSTLDNLTALYDQMVTTVNGLRTTATTVAGLSGTYGDPNNPVSIYVPNWEPIDGQTITGYGTLIVGDKMELKNLSTLNWTGDIFVVGDNTKDAKMKVENSNLNVDGNLVFLGEGPVETEFEIKTGGHAVINGSLFLGSSWNKADNSESEIEVKDGGILEVNGLLTMIGSEIEIEFEGEIDDDLIAPSNPNNAVSINGMLQVAVPTPGDGSKSELEFELEGSVEIVKDDAAILAGIDSLEGLAVDYSITEIYGVIEKNLIETRSWQRVVYP